MTVRLSAIRQLSDKSAGVPVLAGSAENVPSAFLQIGMSEGTVKLGAIVSWIVYVNDQR